MGVGGSRMNLTTELTLLRKRTEAHLDIMRRIHERRLKLLDDLVAYIEDETSAA